MMRGEIPLRAEARGRGNPICVCVHIMIYNSSVGNSSSRGLGGILSKQDCPTLSPLCLQVARVHPLCICFADCLLCGYKLSFSTRDSRRTLARVLLHRPHAQLHNFALRTNSQLKGGPEEEANNQLCVQWRYSDDIFSTIVHLCPDKWPI